MDATSGILMLASVAEAMIIYYRLVEHRLYIDLWWSSGNGSSTGDDSGRAS